MMGGTVNQMMSNMKKMMGGTPVKTKARKGYVSRKGMK